MNPLLPRIFAAALALAGSTSAAAQQAGFIAALTGPTSVRTAQSQPYAAAVGTAVAPGFVVTTGIDAYAELRFAGVALRLAGDTQVELASFDERVLVLNLAYGSLGARFRSPEEAQSFELRTATARVTVQDAGAYRFDAARAGDSVVVSALDGVARLESQGPLMTVQPGTRVELWRGAATTYRLVDLRHDDFDAWNFALDRRAEAYAGGGPGPPPVTYPPPATVYGPPAVYSYGPPVYGLAPPIFVYPARPRFFYPPPAFGRSHPHFQQWQVPGRSPPAVLRTPAAGFVVSPAGAVVPPLFPPPPVQNLPPAALPGHFGGQGRFMHR